MPDNTRVGELTGERANDDGEIKNIQFARPGFHVAIGVCRNGEILTEPTGITIDAEMCEIFLKAVGDIFEPLLTAGRQLGMDVIQKCRAVWMPETLIITCRTALLFFFLAEIEIA